MNPASPSLCSEATEPFPPFDQDSAIAAAQESQAYTIPLRNTAPPLVDLREQIEEAEEHHAGRECEPGTQPETMWAPAWGPGVEPQQSWEHEFDLEFEDYLQDEPISEPERESSPLPRLLQKGRIYTHLPKLKRSLEMAMRAAAIAVKDRRPGQKGSELFLRAVVAEEDSYEFEASRERESVVETEEENEVWQQESKWSKNAEDFGKVADGTLKMEERRSCSATEASYQQREATPLAELPGGEARPVDAREEKLPVVYAHIEEVSALVEGKTGLNLHLNPLAHMEQQQTEPSVYNHHQLEQSQPKQAQNSNLHTPRKHKSNSKQQVSLLKQSTFKRRLHRKRLEFGPVDEVVRDKSRILQYLDGAIQDVRSTSIENEWAKLGLDRGW